MFIISLLLDDRFIQADIPLSKKIEFQVKMQKQMQELLSIEVDLLLMEHVTIAGIVNAANQSQELVEMLAGIFPANESVSDKTEKADEAA